MIKLTSYEDYIKKNVYKLLILTTLKKHRNSQIWCITKYVKVNVLSLTLKHDFITN